MPREFDPTLKVLVETSPAAWLALDGRATAPVTVIDADISSVVSGAADKFLRVGGPNPYIFHLDFQVGHDSAWLPGRLQLYNSVASHRTGLRVRSVAVILHPPADSPQLTGHLAYALPGERQPYLVFRYGVIRVWQTDPAALLGGGLGLLPLAPISAVRRDDLPAVIRAMQRRLRGESRRNELWTAAQVLMGLRYQPDVVDELLRGITEMRESTTYQAILAEGRVEEARRMLLLFGEHSLGVANDEVRAAVGALSDLERLEALAGQLPSASGWAELLGLPSPRRRPGRRRPENRE